jgi:hypothetical protein
MVYAGTSALLKIQAYGLNIYKCRSATPLLRPPENDEICVTVILYGEI